MFGFALVQVAVIMIGGIYFQGSLFVYHDENHWIYKIF